MKDEIVFQIEKNEKEDSNFIFKTFQMFPSVLNEE